MRETPIRVLHINDSDLSGGAARGMYQLHQGLRQIGVDSKVLVRTKASLDPSVIPISGKVARIWDRLSIYMDTLPLRLYGRRQQTPWGIGWFPNTTRSQINRIETDVLHLHWISRGLVPIKTLPKLNRPLVWTLRDTWAFTGGCHYPDNCLRYQVSCGACPLLGSKADHDISRWTWRLKQRCWNQLDIVLAPLSHWLAQCARSSPLFRDKRIEVIPNGLNLQQFKPLDQSFARKTLNLPQDRRIVLFGAINSVTDPRKGFHFLKQAMHMLAKDGWSETTEVVIFGASEHSTHHDLGLKTRYLGYLHDDISLALIYSAADVAVVPSIQEAFGKTALEAMACGTPVVAFGATGLLDIVEHQQTGYLAQPYEPADLAKGIVWILEDAERLSDLRRQARARAEHEFDIQHVARRYLALYKEILGRHD